MLHVYIPELEDLWFRQNFMADEETMSYNHAWGGTIAFPEGAWNDWYDYWIVNHNDKRFYRYLKDDEKGFVGEISYHFDENIQKYIANVIVKAEYRGNGFGNQSLQFLCSLAKENGIDVLYDDIAIDNSSIKLFLNNGFEEEYRTEELIMLKKNL